MSTEASRKPVKGVAAQFPASRNDRKRGVAMLFDTLTVHLMNRLRRTPATTTSFLDPSAHSCPKRSRRTDSDEHRNTTEGSGVRREHQRNRRRVLPCSPQMVAATRRLHRPVFV